MKSISEEIKDALDEERLENSINGVLPPAPNGDYLANNFVSMPLEDYLGFYDVAKAFNGLLDLLLDSSELNYNKDALRVDGFSSENVMNFVKQYRPLEYVERYEALLEG